LNKFLYLLLHSILDEGDVVCVVALIATILFLLSIVQVILLLLDDEAFPIALVEYAILGISEDLPVLPVQHLLEQLLALDKLINAHYLVVVVAHVLHYPNYNEHYN